jgi:hypothetical protein
MADSAAAASPEAPHPTPPPPLRIFQTWKTSDVATFPPTYAACQPTWQLLHPRAVYTLLTDEDGAAFCEEHFPSLLPLYAAVPVGVMRADLLRCMLLFVHGGLYVDMDFMALRDHTPLWAAVGGGTVVLGRLHDHTSLHSLPNAWMMARAPRDILWLAVLEEAWRRCAHAGILDGASLAHCGRGVEELTGPVVLRDVAQEYHRFRGDVAALCPRLLRAVGGAAAVTRGSLQILPSDTVYACDWQQHDRMETMRAWLRDGRPLEQLAAALPRSLAWTPWAHNW